MKGEILPAVRRSQGCATRSGRSDSCPAHQGKSPNLTESDAKAAGHKWGEQMQPADIRTCKPSPREDVCTHGGAASEIRGRVPGIRACNGY